MASRKLLIALACATVQIAPGPGPISSDGVFWLTLDGIRSSNAGRAGARGDLWFVREPDRLCDEEQRIEDAAK